MAVTHNNDTGAFRALRLRVFKRDDWSCRACPFVDETKTGKGLHADHIIPKVAGGSDDPENLQTLCAKCNLKKGKKTAGERVTWFNPRWQDYWK